MPNSFAPFAFRILNASKICSVVIPYLASPGLSIMSLLILKIPPGLYRQLMVLRDAADGPSPRNSMMGVSSRLMMAPSRSASWKSSAGVSLEENMIPSPEMPTASECISSV